MNDGHAVLPLSERLLQATRTAITVPSPLMGLIQAMSPWRGELAIDVYDNLADIARDCSQFREYPFSGVQCSEISFLVQSTGANAIGVQQLRTWRVDMLLKKAKD